MWVLCFVVVASVLGGCTTLDRNAPRTPSVGLTEAEASETSLGRKWSAVAPADPRISAFRLLPNSLEAFAARVAMIDAAERTLDLQYYIFASDETGLYIIDRVVAAADRGVRVRILVDDMYTHGVEKEFAAFDALPNIELRIFNPWTQRSGTFVRAIEFLLTPRLNHRMHNKTIVADGTVAILGGRNLADEYFDLNSEFVFRDLDVAVVGPAAGQADLRFDAFWNCPDSVPITGLKPKPDIEALLKSGRPRLVEHRERMRATAYADAVRSTQFAQQLSSRSVQWVFAQGQVLGDPPEKTTRWDDPLWNQSLASQVQPVFFSAKRELLATSPYFVPGAKGSERLIRLRGSGTAVTILTNSQTATDVPVVHANYAKYRARLVKGGIALYELRRRGAPVRDEDDDKKRTFGSGNSSLHAKTFVVDRQQVFIGSLNLDPRSIVHNTEVGVLIESPELAECVAGSITMLQSPAWSYRLVLSATGDLNWVGEDASGNEIRLQCDPDTSWWDRFKCGLLRLLPIEGQT